MWNSSQQPVIMWSFAEKAQLANKLCQSTWQTTKANSRRCKITLTQGQINWHPFGFLQKEANFSFYFIQRRTNVKNACKVIFCGSWILLFSPLKVQNEIIIRVQVVGLNQFQSFWVSVNVILWDLKVKDSIAKHSILSLLKHLGHWQCHWCFYSN